MSETGEDPAARVRTLLLRADNLLKKNRLDAAHGALEEAAEAAAADGVPQPVRDLVDRRIEALRGLGPGASADG